MSFNCALADDQRLRNRSVGHALCDEARHLAFACRQSAVLLLLALARVPRGSSGERGHCSGSKRLAHRWLGDTLRQSRNHRFTFAERLHQRILPPFTPVEVGKCCIETPEDSMRIPLLGSGDASLQTALGLIEAPMAGQWWATQEGNQRRMILRGCIGRVGNQRIYSSQCLRESLLRQ